MCEEADKAARSYAMTLLSRRAYTEKALYDKLAGRYDERCAASAVARMIELGLLDDEDYALRHAAGLRDFKGMAARRIAQELVRKGIDRELAEAAAEELDSDPETQIAAVIKKRYMRYLDDEKGRRRTVNALLRLGHRYSDIAAVLHNLDEDTDYYDDE